MATRILRTSRNPWTIIIAMKRGSFQAHGHPAVEGVAKSVGLVADGRMILRPAKSPNKGKVRGIVMKGFRF